MSTERVMDRVERIGEVLMVLMGVVNAWVLVGFLIPTRQTTPAAFAGFGIGLSVNSTMQALAKRADRRKAAQHRK